MSEQKLIEALEQIANLDYVGTDKAVAAVRMAAEIAREALAAHAGEQVGLTDAELTGLWMNVRMTFTHTGAINFARAVIAAHEAKRNGGAT